VGRPSAQAESDPAAAIPAIRSIGARNDPRAPEFEADLQSENLIYIKMFRAPKRRTE
jgi:hypothetical protein